MAPIVGFHLSIDLDQAAQARQERALQRTLAHFPWLEQRTMVIGTAQLQLWGHPGIVTRLHQLEDGAWLALIGSPVLHRPWQSDAARLVSGGEGRQTCPEWDGRFILLYVSPDGRCWQMWNDWIGSLTVFHAELPAGWVAGTLEPLVVAAAGFSPQDLNPCGLITLLVHGHSLGENLAYRGMHILPPDGMAIWDQNGFTWHHRLSIPPTNDRWETGWDDLVDEMHVLLRQAVADTLKASPHWVLPLSAGLDSRLIATIGAELGVDMYTYTWGPKDSHDTIYARKIAHMAGLPWQHISLGNDFLVQYTQHWVDLFGRSMDFHGIYLMAFLEAIRNEPEGPVALGFLGDALAGYDVKFITEFHSQPGPPLQLYPEGFIHYPANELRALFKRPIDSELESLSKTIMAQRSLVPGAPYQRYRYLALWTRQRLFTNFQAHLCDYWRGVGTPYFHRAYATFCCSLPRAVLDHRNLLAEVVKRYYPKVAAIPGTYGSEPMLVTENYAFQRWLAYHLPSPLRGVFWPEYTSLSNGRTRDQDSVRAHGQKALWPIWENRALLDDWIHFDQVESNYQAVLQGDRRAMMRLKAVQLLALALQPDNNIYVGNSQE